MSEHQSWTDRMGDRRQEPPFAERRNAPRTLLRDIEGTMSWQGDVGEVTSRVRVLNISGGGAAALADRSPRAGGILRLTLASKPARQEPIEGHVVETRPDPSGKWVIHVRFTQWVPLGPFLAAHRERRLWERHPVRESRARVTWREGATEKATHGNLLNISGGGAAFIGDVLPPQGIPIWLGLEAGIRDGVRIDAIEGLILVTSFDPSGRRVAHIQFIEPCPDDFFELAVGGAG